MLKTFDKLETEAAPFTAELPNSVNWLKPTLVCEVLYQVVTNDGKLRMPRFNGLRTDKPPSECTIDQILPSGLEQYERKRDFNVTTEPAGAVKMNAERIFVVQEHHARHLHYDLRLESDGVLKSWAVPKGIPESPDQKRLAVQVEDHPIDYATFEGSIPEGQYGAGTVTIWDKGTYDIKEWDDNTIEFIPKGKRLMGRYVLVRLKKAGEKNWLLLKARE
jgi:bifunctional non-homologous end joining protein LigD